MSDLMFYNILDRLEVSSANPKIAGNEVPTDIADAWPGDMLRFTQELKAAMGPELYLFGNVDDSEPQFMQNDLLEPGRLDGVIFEDPFNSRNEGNAATLNKVNSLMDIVDRFGKKSIMIVTGSANGTNFSTTSPDQEKLAHRYFLAAYLQTYRSPNHSFLYYHPTSIGPQFRSEAFFKEWDLNLGAPTPASENVGDGVYLRKFERGYVYWNPTGSDYTIRVGSDLYNIENGQDINGQVVPAKSGAFFVTSSVLQEYNTPPSPPPVQKVGDLNGDGNVTLADFNIFARLYKNKDLTVDFNGNGMVDLADLNMLIRNFGK